MDIKAQGRVTMDNKITTIQFDTSVLLPQGKLTIMDIIMLLIAD